MCIILLVYVLKAEESRPEIPPEAYVYIPPWICIQSFGKQTKRALRYALKA